MKKLINIISNSNFEQLSYNNSSDRPRTMSIADWSITDETNIHGNYSYNGGYALLMNSNFKLTGKMSNYKARHKYYYRIYYKTLDDNHSETITTKFIRQNQDSLYESFYASTMKLSINAGDNWTFSSAIISKQTGEAELIESPKITIEQDDDTNILIDSIMLIDLTEAFGEAYEPSKKWCDDNIPYFEKEYELEISSKELEFTCKDSFVYDNVTKKYYTDNNSPKITFLVKNVDRDYNPKDKNKKIRLECIRQRGDGNISANIVHFDELNVIYEGNDCYLSYDGFEFNNDTHVVFRIDSDYSGGVRNAERFEVYYIGNYTAFECDVDCNLNYLSTYLGKLTGITNAHLDVPMNIDVFLNNVKTSPVDILNQDDNLTVFEKELYLRDGQNEIKVVVTDICGNSQEKIIEHYVDCMTPEPEKKDLLTNFIGEDDLGISLSLGNSDLKYETKQAGLNKDIILDTSVESHYFKLLGKNTNLYRISRDYIPKIQGDIIRRPLNIIYDSVEKIYDGTTDITLPVKKLKIHNGYYLHDVHNEYSEYNDTGLVKEINERKVTGDTLAKANEYILDKPNIDFSNVYINIDGIEGYSLPQYEPDVNIATFILQDKSLDAIFKSIQLVKNSSNNTTILKFIYQENIELEYKVINGLNIKYNYSNKTDSEYLIRRISDENSVQVDFSNAFFKSKDVTNGSQQITLNDIKLIGGVSEDASNNYQIAGYAINGKILRRTINPHIRCLDKVYDGSPIIPFEMDDTYYHGLENIIPGDDVYVDNTFEGDRTSEFHKFTKNGNSVLICDNENVGIDKPVYINSFFLEGSDVKNYKIGQIYCNYFASISKRPVEILINKLRFLRASRQWEIDYTILNDIKTDKLTMSYNTGDNLDIKVYGGIDKDNNSIHKNYTNKADIISMFFDYPFDNNYKFEKTINDIDSNIEIEEIKHIDETDKLSMTYWTNAARPAEPDTERIDITIEQNNKYPGGIKLSLDTLSNGDKTSYFESKNREYKLYSGCKVMITNINLNPLNDKSKNYTLINSTYETTIEII